MRLDVRRAGRRFTLDARAIAGWVELHVYENGEGQGVRVKLSPEEAGDFINDLVAVKLNAHGYRDSQTRAKEGGV